MKMFLLAALIIVTCGAIVRGEKYGLSFPDVFIGIVAGAVVNELRRTVQIGR